MADQATSASALLREKRQVNAQRRKGKVKQQQAATVTQPQQRATGSPSNFSAGLFSRHRVTEPTAPSLSIEQGFQGIIFIVHYRYTWLQVYRSRSHTQ